MKKYFISFAHSKGFGNLEIAGPEFKGMADLMMLVQMIQGPQGPKQADGSAFESVTILYFTEFSSGVLINVPR